MEDTVLEFMSNFNKIDAYLQQHFGPSLDFASRINTASKSDAVVRRYKDELHHLRKLRNVIVHETKKNHYVATPFPDTVERLELIYHEITNPEKVFKNRGNTIAHFEVTDPLSSVLRVIEKNHFSQFPIYKGKSFHGLLTSTAITNAIAHMFNEDDGGLILTTDITIQEILEYEEYQEIYKFVPRDMNMYEALEMFNRHKTIEALLVTHNGLESETLLDIVTVWDVMEFSSRI